MFDYLQFAAIIILAAVILWASLKRERKINKLTEKVKEEGERVRALAREISLLEIDYVTGILQRSVWEKRVLYNLRTSDLVICIIDLDGFKSINDRFGHPDGDVVLQNFVRALEKNLRRTDLVGRYGGDEFVVAFNITENFPEDIEAQLARIFRRVQNNFQAYSNDFFQTKQDLVDLPKVGFSYGAVFVSRGSKNISEHITLADQRMYEQKAIRRLPVLNQEAPRACKIKTPQSI